MPLFSYRNLLYTQRTDFLKALAKIHEDMRYPQAVTVFKDLEEFSKWIAEVPVGAWWVDWQSFRVEGEGLAKIRPLHHEAKAQGKYLGKFQGSAFNPASPSR